ncbi:hypothetical protein D3C72_1953330 [compost metagenome]
MLSKVSWTSPDSIAVTTCALPLYGTWVILMPATESNSSPARCPVLPLPAEAKVSLPGLALACAISSCTLFARSDELPARIIGRLATSDTGAKSLRVSYGSLGYRLALMACAASTMISV